MKNVLLVLAVLSGLLMPLFAYGQVTDPASPTESTGSNAIAQAPADESSTERPKRFHLGLKQSKQAGSIELVEQTAVGDVALLRETRFDSQLSWRVPGHVTAGWYRIRFPATTRFQVTAEMQRERDSH